MSGYYFMHRGWMDNPVFSDGPFDERMAWVWLIEEAAWAPVQRRINGHIIELQRGQLTAAIRYLADAWGWSKSRVDRFLKRLENRDMIGTECGTGQQIITICNYDRYQSQLDTSGTGNDQESGHERDTSGTNIKELNNINNKKISLGGGKPRTKSKPVSIPENFPTEIEIQWAVQRGLDPPSARLQAERFQNWAVGNGTERPNWPATWRTWVLKRIEEKEDGKRNSKSQNGTGGNPSRPTFSNGFIENLARQSEIIGSELPQADDQHGTWG